jgi:hypothetical protein
VGPHAALASISSASKPDIRIFFSMVHPPSERGPADPEGRR